MALAIFGISNDTLNFVATLFVLAVVVVWLALIVYTYLDARRRISDPFLVACATIGSFFPYIGTAVYAIVRPPEFLEDAQERELEIRAAELRVKQLVASSCPNCEHPIERDYMRCPQCQRRLKDPCPTCGKPVDPRWALCPYCENALGGEKRRRPRPSAEGRREPRAPRAAPREERPKPKRRPPAKPQGAPATQKDAESAPPPKRQQRSPAREPDADPRKA